MRTSSTDWENLILKAFPERRKQDLKFLLESVTVRPGQILCDIGERTHRVYFPTTSVMSLLDVLEDGSTIEIAVVGNDGVAGICALTGATAAQSRIQARNSGHAFRLPAQWLREVFSTDEAVRSVLMLYMQALMTQIGRTSACVRRHSLVEQVSKWLLYTLDRVPGDELRVTQEMLASTLGVRRERIAHVAQELRGQGIIRYSRGRMEIVDRAGLESRACECYRAFSHGFTDLYAARQQQVGAHAK